MYIFFVLDASTQIFNKIIIITSYDMIIMGGVVQGELTRLVLRNQRCHQLLFKTRDPTFLFYICTCI